MPNLCAGTSKPWGIPSANAKVLVLSNYLPTAGEGWPKAMRHENACLLCGQNLGYHCQCPPKTLLKFQKTGGTVTHPLQVLHTLLRTRPSKDDIIQAFYSYTHRLFGAAVKEVVGPTGLPLRSEQNTELLSCCGLAKTPSRVPLPGLGGKECTAAQREYVPFMAESFYIFFFASPFVWCDLRPFC